MGAKVPVRKQVIQYENFMKSVRVFDSASHSLNDEFEAVNITQTKLKVDRKQAEKVLKVMKPALESIKEKGKALLSSLI